MAEENTAPVTEQSDEPDMPEDLVLHDPSTDESEDEATESEESNTDEEDTSEDTETESEDRSEEATETDGEAESEDDADPKEQARRHYQERQARRREPDQYIQSIQQEAEQQLAQIEDDSQRRVAALEVKDRLREIHEARSSLVTDHDIAQRDFDVFNPKSPEYDERAHEAFLADYEDAYVVKDSQTGEVIGTRGKSLYQYLSEKADLIQQVRQVGARKESSAQAKMRSAVMTPSVSTLKKGSGNNLDDLEERLGNLELT